MNLRTTWLATFTRRWHSNPDMCHVVDPVGGHSERVALIILHCWPDASRDLILAALYHDLAESVIGDIPPAGKAMIPNIAAIEEAIARDNGWHVDLTDQDAARLRFADRLDAYMMAQHERAPDNGDWADAREWLIYAAERMGIRDKLREVI